MGPNDVDIVSVVTRATPGGVAEEALPSNADFVIEVEVEAGSTIFATGAHYELGLVVVDYTGFNLFPTPAAGPNTPNIAVADNMITGGKWTNPSQKFVYTVSATATPPLTSREGHFCEVLASLRVNVTTPDMSLARSGLFLIFKP